MVSLEKKLANAMGGKTARPCDNCIRKRARWYCASDDAFLCQFCDALVHSANPLAPTHQRVSLKMAPTWHQRFTKKSRTPRSNTKHECYPTPKSNETTIMSFNPLHIVPEMATTDHEVSSDDQQVFPYQVPEFDQLSFSGEFNDPTTKQADTKHDHESEVSFHSNSLDELVLPSDLELAEFGGDVIGKSLDEESFDMEALGIMVDCGFNDSERLKVEDEAAIEMMMMMREPFQLSFVDESPVAWEVEDDQKVAIENRLLDMIKKEDGNVEDHSNNMIHSTNIRNSKMLKLDYERIIAAWDDDRSPWTTGDRPQFDPNDCWPSCMGGCGKLHHYDFGDLGNPTRLDGGREARVSRYREKRRTRLFSKKIRYEVRKVNAEKRPRIKGRFVKRTGFAANVSVNS